ncbi:vitellogenin-6-like [Liolophura sinensis]|uniref:vitellogenin-6-like n=1 Tax=Liolophura sinensis TaxID=3198878 RepID=UPI0031595F2F
MNKFLLIALVAGVALATNRREIYESTLSEEIETAYRAGSSYVYNYETQVVNGLPLTAPVYSIVKVKCKVIMEFKTASKVVMKIDGVTLHKLNGRVEAVDPTNEIVPDEVLVPITDDDTAIIERALTLPVKFRKLSNRYTNGFVSGIVCESEDPEWSVNFKKGCLGLLQVNLEKSKLIEASEPVYTEDYSGVTVNEAYTVMETSPAGECACTYIVEENGGEAGEGKTIEVTKVRNFEDCLERPTFYHDNLGTKPCAKCDAVPKKRKFTADVILLSFMNRPEDVEKD